MRKSEKGRVSVSTSFAVGYRHAHCLPTPLSERQAATHQRGGDALVQAQDALLTHNRRDCAERRVVFPRDRRALESDLDCREIARHQHRSPRWKDKPRTCVEREPDNETGHALRRRGRWWLDRSNTTITETHCNRPRDKVDCRVECDRSCELMVCIRSATQILGDDAPSVAIRRAETLGDGIRLIRCVQERMMASSFRKARSKHEQAHQVAVLPSPSPMPQRVSSLRHER